MNSDVPHLAFPVSLAGDGTFAVVEQDSPEDVTQCVLVLLGTPVLSRVELPEYGIPEVLFAQQIDLDGMATAIGDWEPRAVVDLSAQVDSLDELIRHIAANVGVA